MKKDEIIKMQDLYFHIGEVDCCETENNQCETENNQCETENNQWVIDRQVIRIAVLSGNLYLRIPNESQFQKAVWVSEYTLPISNSIPNHLRLHHTLLNDLIPYYDHATIDTEPHKYLFHIVSSKNDAIFYDAYISGYDPRKCIYNKRRHHYK